jgi:peptide deformylase
MSERLKLAGAMQKNLMMVLSADPVLREKAKPVTKFEPPLRVLTQEMVRMMLTQGGIGLAAPQIGMSVQMFVVAGVEDAFINPALRPVESAGKSIQSEGCLSLPGQTRNVERWNEVDVVYVNQFAMPMCLRFDGMLARVIQHEFDHLQGVLITDYPEAP